MAEDDPDNAPMGDDLSDDAGSSGNDAEGITEDSVGDGVEDGVEGVADNAADSAASGGKSVNGDPNSKDDANGDGKSEGRGKGADGKSASGESGDGKPAPKQTLGQRIQSIPGKIKAMPGNMMAFGRNKALSAADHIMNGAVKAATATIRGMKTLAHKAKQLAGKTLAFLKAVFLPPGLWVNLTVFLVIFGIIGTITAVQTYGPSDMDCNAVDEQSNNISSGGSGTTSSDGEWTQKGTDAYNNAQNVWNYWKSKGFSGAAIAGIMGNVATESANTFSPTIVQGGGHSEDPSSAGSNGYGLYQFTPGSKYKNWSGYTSPSVSNESDAVWSMEVGAWSSGSYAELTDVATATKYWMKTYERPKDQSDSAAAPRITHAKKAYELFGGDSVNFDKSKFDAAGGTSGSSAAPMSSDGSDAAVDTTQCDKTTTAVSDGSTSGLKECDKGGCDYSWMCSSQNVCKSGDAGRFYAHLEYGYQCVWYAWNRLAMIHGSKGWTWVHGDGGDIWANLTGNSSWEVDRTPHVGDGLSGHGAPFALTTHVAVVEKVVQQGDSWKIYVSEGNWTTSGDGPWNGYHTRWLTKSQVLTGDNHFFRSKSW